MCAGRRPGAASGACPHAPAAAHPLLPDCPPLPPGTLLGCLPNNLVAVNAGSHLGELRSLSDLYSTRLLALGATVGLAALSPIYFKRRAAAKEAAALAAKRD